MRLATFFAAALAGLTFAADIAEAQRGDRGRRDASITLYEHPNFRGRSVEIRSDVSNLRNLNFNDVASSLRVNGGQWEVCIDSNFRGSCTIVDGDNPNMSAWAFNDRITSVRPAHRENRRGRVRENGVTLWSGPNFTGRSVTLVRSEDRLSQLSFNDAAQSIEVHSGTWTFCEHANFQGRCVDISRNVRNLSSFNLNRQISSVTNDYRPDYDNRPDYGGGRARIDGAVRGVNTLFFPQPEVRGYPVARCLGDQRGCGQQTADRICELSGYDRAEYFSSRSTSRPVWFIAERDARSGRAQITDVLCIRR